MKPPLYSRFRAASLACVLTGVLPTSPLASAQDPAPERQQNQSQDQDQNKERPVSASAEEPKRREREGAEKSEKQARIQAVQEQLHQQMAALEAKAGEAKQAGRQDELNELQKQMHELKGRMREVKPDGDRSAERRNVGIRDGDRPNGGLEQRMQHLKQAIAHLREAGLGDVAAKLEKEAPGLMQQQERDRAQQETGGDGSNAERLSNQLREMQTALRNLHERMERMESQKR